MSRNVAIFLVGAGFVFLAINLAEFVESGTNRGIWLRIASNICIIIVGIGGLMTSKNEKK